MRPTALHKCIISSLKAAILHCAETFCCFHFVFSIQVSVTCAQAFTFPKMLWHLPFCPEYLTNLSRISCKCCLSPSCFFRGFMGVVYTLRPAQPLLNHHVLFEDSWGWFIHYDLHNPFITTMFCSGAHEDGSYIKQIEINPMARGNLCGNLM